jgi:hypothetical protein
MLFVKVDRAVNKHLFFGAEKRDNEVSAEVNSDNSLRYLFSVLKKQEGVIGVCCWLKN